MSCCCVPICTGAELLFWPVPAGEVALPAVQGSECVAFVSVRCGCKLHDSCSEVCGLGKHLLMSGRTAVSDSVVLRNPPRGRTSLKRALLSSPRAPLNIETP